MATISFTLSAADLVRAVTALSVRFGYSTTLPDGSANPQSAQEFVRQRIGRWVREETQAHELASAQAAVIVDLITVT